MSELVSKKINGVDTLVLEQTLNQDLVNDGHVTIDFATENTFVDQDIHVDLTVPSAADPALSLTDLTSEVNMGTASNGYYNPTVALSGNAAVATAGWITAGNHSVSDDSVGIGKIAQSTMSVGGDAIDSGDTVVPDTTNSQTVSISAGYEGARTVVVGSMADGQAATVDSANATVSSVTFTNDSTNHTFDIAGSATIAAPSVSQDGYISSTVGTKNSGTASVAASVDEITVGVTPSTTTQKVTPVIARTAKPTGDSWADAASGDATTTKPSSGAYVQVDAAAVAATVTATGKVSAAGYGTTTEYQADSATTITVGSNAAATAYVPIAAGTATSGSAEINSVSVAYNTTGGNFNVTGSANVSAPTVGTAGYVGNGVGTLSANNDGATVDASIAKIAIGATISGGSAVTPVISKNAATNVDASAATTSQPAGGFYVAVGSAADSSSVTAAAAVTSAGYGTTTEGQYTTVGDSATVTVNASDVTYIPIAAGELGNTPATGKQATDYVDLSSTGPIIPSAGYLYIEEGYYADSRISLARLVPDQATITPATGADYILSGQSAYDNDGNLIVGTIPTYDGSYTIA